MPRHQRGAAPRDEVPSAKRQTRRAGRREFPRLSGRLVCSSFGGVSAPSREASGIIRSSSRCLATSVSKLTPPDCFQAAPPPSPLPPPGPAAVFGPAERWMKGGVCLFSDPNCSQTGGEPRWVCVGVANPGSFLRNIPSLCEEKLQQAEPLGYAFRPDEVAAVFLGTAVFLFVALNGR